MKQQRGLSLVELMIAMLISTLLLLGVLQLFSNTTSSDRANTALARVQESGRVALEMIGADARRSSFQGCLASNSETVVGALTLPDDAIATAAGSITFRYAVTDASAGPQLPIENVSCGASPQRLYLNTVTYSNCADGSSLCRNGDPIMGNAQFDDIQFAIPIGANTTWKGAPSNTELAQAWAVRITLNVIDPRQNIERDFTGTYDFRNRLR